MRTPLACFALMLSTYCCAQNHKHLTPAEHYYGYDKLSTEYREGLFSLLYQEFSTKPYARYTSLPSFQAEYAFSVEQRDTGYYIISNRMSPSYYHAMEDRSSVKVIGSATHINEKLYRDIGTLFRKLGEQTRPINGNRPGSDGTNYYFTTTDDNGKVLIGETWSPGENSPLGKLVRVCDKLYELGKGKKVDQRKLDKEITDLTDLLNKG